MSNLYQASHVIRGTRANLVAANTIFPTGYVIIETDTGAIRVADGTTAYSSLVTSVSQWFGKMKLSSTAKTSDATLADDTDLFFAMLASTNYAFRFKVFYDTAATPDFKFAIDAPASPTLIRLVRKHIDPGALTSLVVASEVAEVGSTALAGGTGTTGGFVEAEGIVHNGANAGNLAFQWAQNTSNASATTVLAGSYIEWRVF